MADPSRDEQGLDARLSEIDRRLREIQAELAPPPGQPPLPRERTGPLAEVLQHGPRRSSIADQHLVRRIEELTETQGELLSSLRQVLQAFERALAGASATAEGELTVTVGPFASIEAVREFEHELGALPGVKSVAVRGYEGADRAVLDVQLSGQ